MAQPDLNKAIERYAAAVTELAAAKAELDEMTTVLTPPVARLEVQAIQEVVAIYFRLSPHVMWSKGKHEPLATARNIAMALSVRLTGEKVEAVALAFRRTRNCVYWAEHSVSARHDTETTYRAMLSDIETRCRARLEQIAA